MSSRPARIIFCSLSQRVEHIGRIDVTLNIFYANKKQNEKQGKRWDENSSNCSHLLN